MPSRLVVCDLCDTLYRSNTTYDFVQFVLRGESRNRLLIFNLLTKKWSPAFVVLTILNRIFSGDLNRALILKLISGFHESTLSIAARKFYNAFLSTRRNEKIFDLLKGYERDSKIVLVSSSINPVVQMVARANGFNHFIASILETNQGKYTGNLSTDLAGKKQHHVQDVMLNEGFDELIVITDNRSDKILVKMADKSHIVIKSESDKAFWKDVKADFIMIL
ncbi:MAG: haloacid dehalogenase-like hydrolase [Cyclobacteriaceae bacterium]